MSRLPARYSSANDINDIINLTSLYFWLFPWLCDASWQKSTGIPSSYVGTPAQGSHSRIAFPFIAARPTPIRDPSAAISRDRDDQWCT